VISRGGRDGVKTERLKESGFASFDIRESRETCSFIKYVFISSLISCSFCNPDPPTLPVPSSKSIDPSQPQIISLTSSHRSPKQQIPAT
jgi:hypothetical protein